MILKSFFSFLMVSVLFSGLSFAGVESKDRAKARQAVLADIKKRQAALTSIKQKRTEKQQQRQMVEARDREFEQAKEALQFAFYWEEEKARAGRSQDFFKDSKPVAQGIILKFSQWPPSEETVILNKLQSVDLEEDAKLKRLQKWIYRWPQPRQVSEAEKLCRDLSSFRSVEYCEPDVSVGPAQSRDELYRKQLEKAKQKVKEAEKTVEEAKKDVKEAQKEHDEIQGYVQQDQQAVKDAESTVESDKRSVERARQRLERARQRNQGVAETEKRFEDRKRVLADSEKWLTQMREQLKKSKQELADGKKWLEDSKKFLKDSEKSLKDRKDWLKELESRPPTTCQNGKVWDGSACVCPNGQNWDGSACVVPRPTTSVCPSGSGQSWSRYEKACVCPDDKPKWDGSKCVVAACSAKQEWDKKKKRCVVDPDVCPVGQKWGYIWKKCFCPEEKPKWDGSKCIISGCPGGKRWDRNKEKCACPRTKPKWDGSKCIVSSCPDGKRWNGNNEKCVCSHFQEWDGSKCVANSCYHGFKFKEKCTCFTNYKWDGSQCADTRCDGGKIWSGYFGKCICPNDKPKWDGSKCADTRCDGGKYWNSFWFFSKDKCICPNDKPKWDGSKCVSDPCPGEQTWIDSVKKCFCPKEKPKWDGSKCIAAGCPGGQYWNQYVLKCMCPYNKPKWDGSQCILPNCPDGKVWNRYKKKCVCELGSRECADCQEGTHWNGKKCVTCRNGMEWNESVSVCACPMGHTWNGSKCVVPKAEAKNVRTCGVLPSNFNLGKEKIESGRGTLPDYWAQKMVGADLLKKEIESAPPIEKKPFVQLFDSNRQGRHDEFVKNIISGNGKNSVLPELRDGIRTFETNYLSDYSKHTERLLDEVDKVCGESSNTDTPSNTGGSGNR